MVMKSLKHVLILFFKTVSFLCILPIPCIGTVFLYWNIWWWYPSCYYWTPDSCMLSPDTCLISLIICRAWYLTYNYHNTGTMTWYLDISWYIYTSTNRTPDTLALLTFLTCSCSFSYTDNYLVKYKKDNLHRVREKLIEFKWWICLSWY